MIRIKEEVAMTYEEPFIKGIRPYAHQVVQQRLIQQIFREGKRAVIWNQASTGAGKTLANYSFLVKNPQIRALGVYPVNELIKDQFHSLQTGLPLGKWDEVALWTAEEMRKSRQPGESKIEQVYRMTSPYYRGILTNPDHLMLIAQERLFSYKAGERSEPLYRLAEYQLQIFDEFHLYDIAQVNFLVQWMGLLLATFPEKAYAFLLSSATPRADVFQLLERMNVEIWNVQEEVERWLAEERPKIAGERIFLEPLQLHLKPCNLRNWNTGEKIVEHWDEVEAYLAEWPQAKGLIILDSIHEAQVLAQTLREKGYEVGEVHGLSDRSRSREELAKPISVATATVEVGVDFQGEIHKDFLLFEARNAGSFIQRIGRIGRGSRPHPEPPLHVWAYVPHYVAEQIRDEAPAELTRTEMQQLVSDSYQYYQDFFPYIEKVGGMNLVHGYHQIKRHQIDREANPILDGIRKMVDAMYQLDFGEQEKQYFKWKKKKIIEPVLSFRGHNTMEHHILPDHEELETFYPDLWFWDETAPDRPLKKYDYAFVLRRREVQFVTKEELICKVKEHYSGVEREELLAELKRDQVLGYAIATGVREKPAFLYWELPLAASRISGQLVRMDRLYLHSREEDLQEQLSALFNFRQKKSWIVYISKQSVNELTDSLRLPPLFRLYPARTRQGADWSIAFNSEAFQLWSVLNQSESVVL